MLLYIHRDGCVTRVNEQRVRANTQGAWGALASWRCSALQVPPLGFHRESERPRNPSAGLEIILLRIKDGSTAMASGPSQSPRAEHRGWSSSDFAASPRGAGRAQAQQNQALVPHKYVFLVLDLARLSSVQLPRSQTPLPKVELCRAGLCACPIPLCAFTPRLPSMEAVGYPASTVPVPCLCFSSPVPPSLCCSWVPQLCLSVHLSLPE